MSRFAMGRTSSRSDAPTEGSADASQDPARPGPNLDDPRVEAKMMQLMSRMETMDENDGRSMGRMMRELAAVTGEGADDPAMQEAIRRLESGEDPEKVEEIVSDAYGEDSLGGSDASMGAPSMDTSLYDM